MYGVENKQYNKESKLKSRFFEKTDQMDCLLVKIDGAKKKI